jgi:hypothetical protein
LRGRSGTEIVTIDLALGLKRRGYEVAVFAPLLGKSAEIVRDQGMVVTDRPEDLPWKPDIIHGHHNHVLAAALAYFPDVPALFISHSSVFWFDGPPLLPRVRRFCAVDEVSRDRVAAEAGCERETVDLLPNAVDLDLFSPRPPLPAQPRRALLLTKNNAHVSMVRAAAREAALELDEIGSAFGREVDDLHERLRQYDIVFATGRMALEALAVGCAVVVGDGRGFAGLVTSSLVDEWRRNNFGLRLLTQKATPELVLTEIGRYDARDAALVSGRIRDMASLSAYLDRVEALYRDVTSIPDVLPNATADLRALGSFIAQWLRRLGEGMIPENFDNLLAANRFADEHLAVVEDNAKLRVQLQFSETRVDALSSRLDALNRETVMLRDTIGSPRKLVRFYASAARRRFFGGHH